MDRAKIVKRLIVISYIFLIHLSLGYLLLERFEVWRVEQTEPDAVPAIVLGREEPSVPETEPPQLPPDPLTSQTPSPAAAADRNELRPGGRELIVPVAGVPVEKLVDTFTNSRGTDRTHDAIDIMAPAGTPVLAAADGQIVKFFDSQAGGITIYQSSLDKRYIYYYAHLQSRAADLKEGDMVKQGRTIGYVGDTGNAGAGNYHLHFSVALVTDPKRYWEGTYINPFTLLR